jgi:hypothetical protein
MPMFEAKAAAEGIDSGGGSDAETDGSRRERIK